MGIVMGKQTNKTQNKQGLESKEEISKMRKPRARLMPRWTKFCLNWKVSLALQNQIARNLSHCNHAYPRCTKSLNSGSSRSWSVAATPITLDQEWALGTQEHFYPAKCLLPDHLSHDASVHIFSLLPVMQPLPGLPENWNFPSWNLHFTLFWSRVVWFSQAWHPMLCFQF